MLADPSGSARVVSRRVESAGLQVADTLGVFGSYRDLSPNDPRPASSIEEPIGLREPARVRARGWRARGDYRARNGLAGRDARERVGSLGRRVRLARRPCCRCRAAAFRAACRVDHRIRRRRLRLCTLAPGLTVRARLLTLGLPRHPPSGDRAPSPGHRAPTRPAGCAGSTAGLVTHRLDRFQAHRPGTSWSAASTVSSASSTAATHTATWIGSIPSPRRFAFGISSFAFEGLPAGPTDERFPWD